jgi:plastocyanin
MSITGAIMSALNGAGLVWIGVGFLLAMHTAEAADRAATVEVTIQDHRFSPSEIHVQAGQPTFLEVANHDAQAEEFEMRQLGIEKLIPAGGKGRVRLRPLGPGRYPFLGEFHEDTAQGAVIAE